MAGPFSETTVSVDSDTSPGSLAGPGDVLLVTGEGRLQTFPLDREELIIGRAPDCDVVLDHRTLSRHHARLRVSPVAAIQDLDSTNGVSVGRERRQGGDPVQLEIGETFRIGPFTFVLLHASAGREPSISSSGPEPLRIVDPAPERASSLVCDIAASDATVLILGETGVGKEVFAQPIHELSGVGAVSWPSTAGRSRSPCSRASCSGTRRGAFTGAIGAKPGLLETASGGTVFLDEVGEMPPALQVKLLRVLEERGCCASAASSRPIDVRFIAATNRDLREVADGRFRADLFFRLDGITLHDPPAARATTT